jgi:hypothetical protein
MLATHYNRILFKTLSCLQYPGLPLSLYNIMYGTEFNKEG